MGGCASGEATRFTNKSRRVRHSHRLPIKSMIYFNNTYKINTQSELVELFHQREEIEKEFDSLQAEYNRMWNEHCKEIHAKLNVLHGKKKLSKTVSYMYSGHPLRSEKREYGVHISEPMAAHKRYACWCHDVLSETLDTGIFYNGDKEEWYCYSEDQFLNHADDWVIDGKLPDNSYIA